MPIGFAGVAFRGRRLQSVVAVLAEGAEVSTEEGVPFAFMGDDVVGDGGCGDDVVLEAEGAEGFFAQLVGAYIFPPLEAVPGAPI